VLDGGALQVILFGLLERGAGVRLGHLALAHDFAVSELGLVSDVSVRIWCLVRRN